MRKNLLGCLMAVGLLSGSMAANANLVVNGSFESGNVSFTSDYLYNPATGTPPDVYTVGSSPTPWHPAWVSLAPQDGSLMFIANGSENLNDVVWQSNTFSIVTGTKYYFQAWVANVCCDTNFYTGPNEPAKLEFQVVNGAPISLGTVQTTLSPGTWQLLTQEWVATYTGTVSVRLLNQVDAFGGNDFALDNITFDTQSQTVPLPAAAWLLLSGLGGLGFVARRKSKA